MRHFKIKCNYGYDDCFKCKLLKDCFPKTYALRQKARIKNGR